MQHVGGDSKHEHNTSSDLRARVVERSAIAMYESGGRLVSGWPRRLAVSEAMQFLDGV